jgi:hypothetical protein
MSLVDGEHKTYHNNAELYQHFYIKNNEKEGEYKQYHDNEKLEINCFYKNDKIDGEYKSYYNNGQLHKYCFYKDKKKNGEYKQYYTEKRLFMKCFHKNDKIEGECKKYYGNNILLEHEYYINDIFIVNLNFKMVFALLKFKDILKSRYRKPIYKKLDKMYINDISNIIGSYLFTLSKLNNRGKRILL